MICFLQFQYKVYRKSQSNTFLTAIISKKNNLCKVLANPKIDPYFYKFIQNISRYFSLFQHCPVKVVRITLYFMAHLAFSYFSNQNGNVI